jgi:beta-phosphoglucomutase-like phosphatase (HAD superfamily)
MIRALVFDFDGLILDTESALIRAYADVHAAHGVPFDEAEFLRSVGHADYAFDPWHAFEKRAARVALETARRERNHAHDLALPVLPGVLALLDAARALTPLLTEAARNLLAGNPALALKTISGFHLTALEPAVAALPADLLVLTTLKDLGSTRANLFLPLT